MFGADFSLRGHWRVLYEPPIEKRRADLQWRVIHRAIVTDRHMAHLNLTVGRECSFCGQEKNLDHLFLRCGRLRGLFNLLTHWVQGLGEGLSFKSFIGGPKYSVLNKENNCILNYVSGLAKLCIWKTRKNNLLQAGFTDPERMLMGLMTACLNIEFAYRILINDTPEFCTTWLWGGFFAKLVRMGS